MVGPGNPVVVVSGLPHIRLMGWQTRQCLPVALRTTFEEEIKFLDRRNYPHDSNQKMTWRRSYSNHPSTLRTIVAVNDCKIYDAKLFWIRDFELNIL